MGYIVRDVTPYANIALEHNLIYLMPQSFYSLAVLPYKYLAPHLTARDEVAAIWPRFLQKDFSSLESLEDDRDGKNCRFKQTFREHVTNLGPEWMRRYAPLVEMEYVANSARLCSICNEKMAKIFKTFRTQYSLVGPPPEHLEFSYRLGGVKEARCNLGNSTLYSIIVEDTSPIL
ncbi:hypothetical protein M422DRAFT_45512 [Sphaerobolus stellatus SS14]|uniref:Uncharacterized protein n=1 Tax=Sphaerobolus stellatus (strain SS14) TaxID=990650 RepID=A0A0C9W636_SPHS4|nr:hypothetical protein M422DRAFT_45512 [Sphaerobolus stellatus SS14]